MALWLGLHLCNPNQRAERKKEILYYFGSVTDTIIRTNHSWDMGVMAHIERQVSIIENLPITGKKLLQSPGEMGCWRLSGVTSCGCSWHQGRHSALQRPRRRKGARAELRMNKADVYGEIIKSNMDKAESTWARALLWKGYKSILMRSLLLL